MAARRPAGPMYRIARDALALVRTRGPAGLLKRATEAAAWRRLALGGLQFRDRKPVLARQHLCGEGLEIGALHNPLPVGDALRVRFVDRFDVAGLRKHYPEMRDVDLVPVDIVDDGERLDRVPPASQDFIIASHFIEHCENPLGSIRTHLDRLRIGGKLFYAIPDKRMTFDRKRANTPFEHLVADDSEGPLASREAHYREWADRVLDKHGRDADEAARKLMAEKFSIHFHCWDRKNLEKFFGQAREYLKNRFCIIGFCANGPETIVILERRF